VHLFGVNLPLSTLQQAGELIPRQELNSASLCQGDIMDLSVLASASTAKLADMKQSLPSWYQADFADLMTFFSMGGLSCGLLR